MGMVLVIWFVAVSMTPTALSLNKPIYALGAAPAAAAGIVKRVAPSAAARANDERYFMPAHTPSPHPRIAEHYVPAGPLAAARTNLILSRSCPSSGVGRAGSQARQR